MPRFLWVVIFALLVVRMGDAHLHLCLDGQEPRSAFHVADRGPHHHGSSGAETEHLDTDVSLTARMLSKIAKMDFDLPLFVVGALLLWALFALSARAPVAISRPTLATAAPAFLRPPLRGPPR